MRYFFVLALLLSAGTASAQPTLPRPGFSAVQIAMAILKLVDSIKWNELRTVHNAMIYSNEKCKKLVLLECEEYMVHEKEETNWRGKLRVEFKTYYKAMYGYDLNEVSTSTWKWDSAKQVLYLTPPIPKRVSVELKSTNSSPQYEGWFRWSALDSGTASEVEKTVLKSDLTSQLKERITSLSEEQQRKLEEGLLDHYQAILGKAIPGAKIIIRKSLSNEQINKILRFGI